ncbi:disulfide bond formation protein B [Mangrovicella endophytica]|uniref:disulfide bond formation protein B n=1 Tax=Mangrovicella endophytica TaxID=2066697 RepID=UPI000C9E1A93|nr:disulfide bond formation protein B [Mangrovicella endophytica]
MSTTERLTRPSGPRQLTAAIVLALGIGASVGTALLFEHVGGYIPCALCLQERIPYYAAVPLAVVTAVLATRPRAGALTRALLVLIGLVMLYSLSLGIYHAGVEWSFWAGPTDCAQSGGADLTGDLLSAIDAVQPPSCSEAAGRFLGLSFAGWNALGSALFAAIAFVAAFGRSGRASA